MKLATKANLAHKIDGKSQGMIYAELGNGTDTEYGASIVVYPPAPEEDIGESANPLLVSDMTPLMPLAGMYPLVVGNSPNNELSIAPEFSAMEYFYDLDTLIEPGGCIAFSNQIGGRYMTVSCNNTAVKITTGDPEYDNDQYKFFVAHIPDSVAVGETLTFKITYEAAGVKAKEFSISVPIGGR